MFSARAGSIYTIIYKRIVMAFCRLHYRAKNENRASAIENNRDNTKKFFVDFSERNFHNLTA